MKKLPFAFGALKSKIKTAEGDRLVALGGSITIIFLPRVNITFPNDTFTEAVFMI